MSDNNDKPGSGANADEPDSSFLTRWSRRKQLARTVPLAEAEEGASPGAKATEPPEPQVDLAKLPKVEDLTVDSDMTQFLQKGVPEELKRLALRRAWALDPTISGFVEMAENQYDFNAPHTIPGFGDIAPGTSIEALLAQATGKGLPPAPTTETSTTKVASVDADEQISGNSEDAATQQHSAAALSQHGASEPQAADPEQNPTQPARSLLVASDVAAPKPLRRRHGGALPA